MVEAEVEERKGREKNKKKKGRRWGWMPIGAVVAVMIALAVGFFPAHNFKSCPCAQVLPLIP